MQIESSSKSRNRSIHRFTKFIIKKKTNPSQTTHFTTATARSGDGERRRRRAGSGELFVEVGREAASWKCRTRDGGCEVSNRGIKLKEGGQKGRMWETRRRGQVKETRMRGLVKGFVFGGEQPSRIRVGEGFCPVLHTRSAGEKGSMHMRKLEKKRRGSNRANQWSNRVNRESTPLPIDNRSNCDN